ncbi:MAG: Formate/nitrite family of transporter [Candidatus Methanohalarchaeum thermophilum]|uniref:Formate/nitrite family of transporter n=1 Tax=Methanohalarchaeum thermophilum TaxID=1903181 RepID=A0A1Q6DVF6_METT1|nr:MAG: Formate/nitrite family of transporter [Candidatus Methanohalarchaeum thermophilum]
MVDEQDNRGSNENQISINQYLENRFTAEEIFGRIIRDADEEISRSYRELFFSALAAGFAITITVLLYSTMLSTTDGQRLSGALLYPLGFIYIILGNHQLYTENTLPPVTLVLKRMVSVPALLMMWVIVFLGNITGGGLGALALSKALSPGASKVLQEMAANAMALDAVTLFFKAIFAGFIVAGAVWLDFSSQGTTSRFFIVYLSFLAIPLGKLYHVVVASTEAFYLVLNGSAAFLSVATNLILPILVGNTIGGVFFVTIVNYFQTPRYFQKKGPKKLPIKDWLFSLNRGKDPRKSLKNKNN